MQTCELCSTSGGDLIWSDEKCRVILVEGNEATLYPGFCRVVWTEHVAEMSDLSVAESAHLMQVVRATEQAVRATVVPDKINLASLGNVVPHLHWHIIPRWHDDACFPSPIWAAALRAAPVRTAPDKSRLHAALVAALASANNP